MNTKPCTLRFQYTDKTGMVHVLADCGACYTVQWASSPGGPWHFDRDGVAGQDIPIRPEDFSNRYYRVIPRECTVKEKAELEQKA